jgi:four helix bundle protein
MKVKFHQLRIWQEGYELLMEIYNISSVFPLHEKYSLTSQITRSANSVIANIAEAHGRYYYADRVRVFYIARAEIQETQSHLRVALGLNYISQEKFDGLNRRYEGLKIGICKYINSLK